MKNKDFSNLKGFNKYYIRYKESELKSLEDEKAKITQEIEQQKVLNDRTRIELQKLSFENEQLVFNYNSLKATIVNRGLIIDIENNNLDIKEWENLYLSKKSTKYCIVTKKNKEIYYFNKDTGMLMEAIMKEGYSCSIVAIRITNKVVKVQLRFLRKKE
jgi:hypothetical protein